MSDAPDPDLDEQRAASRAAWERQAAAWERLRSWQQAAFEPISQWMVDAISPQPGHVVLEAAAGLGDTGLLAAELVHPGGRVILADGAEAMVAAARRHAEERGILNVEATPMELEWLDMSAASIDGLLVRFGYMLVPDPETALRDARRVLRPGGRIALAVWDRYEDNPWFRAPIEILLAHGALAEWPGSSTHPFALGDRERLLDLLGGAGFVLPEVERLEIVYRSSDAATQRQRFLELSGVASTALAALDGDERAAVEAEIDAAFAAFPDPDGPEGAVAVPGAVLVAAADA
ncbi:class I SAM-dependent methyltransferase [Patulibacter defluvii]|uniref:class I SAM-dependent methyltransferase n=1 Tax=Patulibacter defluvii TaxID=3095358 RepID=UPI002A75B31E|nr:class I SAM-dependent methyltransferase [Patulibacter sp. DM4]